MPISDNKTANYKWIKPTYDEITDIMVVSNSLDDIDATVKNIEDNVGEVENKTNLAIEAINEVENKTNLAIEAINKAASIMTATITTTWEGTAAPYTQEIAITDITADDNPIISPVYDSDNTTAIKQQEAWNLIGKIETGADKITIICFEEKPTMAIPIQLKGV